MARDVFLKEVQNYGMACQPSLSRHPPCIVLRRLSETVFFYSNLRFAFFNINANRF